MSKLTMAGITLAAAAALTGGLLTSAAHAGPSAPNTNNPNPSSAGITADAAVPQRVFAVVNADGTKLRGKAVASTTLLSTGVYDVRFNRDISTCSWVGMVGRGDFVGTTGPGVVTATGRNGTNNGLYIDVYGSDYVHANLPFHIDVICG